MLYIVILMLLAASFSLSADEEFIPKSEENFGNSINLESEPTSLVNFSVNVITGDYCDTQQDLVLPGPRPLTLERAYSSGDYQKGSLYHGWHFNHCGEIKISSDKKSHKATWCDSLGGKRSYLGNSLRYGAYVPLEIQKECLQKGITNCGMGKIGGRTNFKNSQIFYCKKKDACFVRMPDQTEKHFERRQNLFRLCRDGNPIGHQFHYSYENNEKTGLIQSRA